MTGYYLLGLDKNKSNYGFLGIRNNELYTDYSSRDGARFKNFEEAKPYIDRLVKAGFRVRLWGTGDYSKDRRIFENKGTKLMEEKNLKKIFDNAFSGGKIPAFETANGVMYLEPKGDKIIIGDETNAGVIPEYEFDYDFDQSFDWNIQGMIDQVLEKEGYPEDYYDENYKGRKSMKKRINEANYEGGDAYYQFCKDIKSRIDNGEDFEDAVYSEIDDLVYYSDVINIWTNMPGNLGSREQEITDLMREDIQEITDLMREDIQDAVFEEQDYIEGLDENYKGRKSMKKRINEMVIDVILDRKDDDTVWTDDGPVPYNPESFYKAIADYGDAAWGITRAMDSGTEADVKKALKQYITDNGYSEEIKNYIDSVDWLDENYKGRKSVNEISVEKAKAATEARKQRMANLGSKYGGEVLRDYRSSHDKRVKPSKLSHEEMTALADKWHDSQRKYLKDRDILDKKMTKSESLSQAILKDAHSVLTMNESEASEMTTWQFTARGFSKAMINKQPVFGSDNIRCIIHENANGKVVGTAVVDYYMSEAQVEEAIKKALAENGFRASNITDLVNLY